MEILVAGISHRTAPLDLRERVALGPDEVPPALARLLGEGAFTEGLLLSTCNRTEVYARPKSDGPSAAGASAKGAQVASDFLASLRPALAEEVRPRLYVREGDEALRHIFRVAAGLDSMVVGEGEIARQMSDAYTIACRAGTAGPALHRVVPRALQVGKRIRSETGLSRGAASVAGAAMSLAERVFRDASSCTVLAVGAGETVETALRVLRPSGGRLVVANRTPARAERLAAEYGGTARTLADIPSLLAAADIVVAATSSPVPLVRRADLAAAARHRARPMLVLDLGVPRDVEPSARDVENVYLHDVDDLRAIADRGAAQRASEVPKAEAIVSLAVAEFARRRRHMEAEPAIKALLEGLLALRADVLSEEDPRSPDAKLAAERATGRLVDKVIRRLAPPLKDGTLTSRELLDAFGIDAAKLRRNDEGEDVG
ncbi:MAG: Glutamyl-tRNA reductase [Planctomycetes bacterium]|nr:Glutamyl-tRNA reductase [Planctomycetota bacterium]